MDLQATDEELLTSGGAAGFAALYERRYPPPSPCPAPQEGGVASGDAAARSFLLRVERDGFASSDSLLSCRRVGPALGFPDH